MLLFLVSGVIAKEKDKPHISELVPNADGGPVILPSRPKTVSPDSTSTREKMSRPPREPLKDTGETGAFSYKRSTQYEGVYEVQPKDENYYVPVSDSFLSLVLNNSTLDEDRKLRILTHYPDMVERNYAQRMQMTYPDNSLEYPDKFNEITIGSSDGIQAFIIQDDLASPYVRVQIMDEGVLKEFSLARSIVETLLKTPNKSDEEKVRALESFTFRLPEKARSNFENLTSEELYRFAEEEYPVSETPSLSACTGF